MYSSTLGMRVVTVFILRAQPRLCDALGRLGRVRPHLTPLVQLSGRHLVRAHVQSLGGGHRLVAGGIFLLGILHRVGLYDSPRLSVALVVPRSGSRFCLNSIIGDDSIVCFGAAAPRRSG